MNNSYYIFYTLLSLIAIPLFPQKATNVTKWQNNEVVLDGSISEFCELPRYYDSNTKLFYEFRNDDLNVYFIFFSKDKISNMKILNSGISIVADTIRVKKSDNIISLKIPHTSDEKVILDESGGKPPFNNKISVIPQIDSKGFNLFKFQDNNISACFSYNRDSVIFGEIVIPLSILCSDDFLMSETAMIYFLIKLDNLEMVSGVQRFQGTEESKNFYDSEDMQGITQQQGDFRKEEINGFNGEPPDMKEMRTPHGNPPLTADENNFGEVKITGKFVLAK